MKKQLLLSMAAAMVLGSSLTVCAAPQYMADGAIFDPEWYLEQNPDVAGWELGTSADALYEHYVQHGAGEGRTPYNKATLNMANILPYQGPGSTAAQPAGTEPTTPTVEQEQPTTPAAEQEQPATPAASLQSQVILMQDGKQLTDENTVIAVEGQNYSLNLYNDYSLFGYSLVNFSFHRVPKSEMMASMEKFVSVSDRSDNSFDELPGYEWREVQIVLSSDDSMARRIQLHTHLDLYAENGSDMKSYGFTVNQDGTDYPECRRINGPLWVDASPGSKDKVYYIFVLVPENYSGGMSIILSDWNLKNTVRFDF